MTTRLLMITPINCKETQNLGVNEYILLYLDKENKLKRAIPDFDESFVDCSDSLIYEAIQAEHIAPFKIVYSKDRIDCPVFLANLNEDNEVVSCTNLFDRNVKIETFLPDSNKRQTIGKLLQKIR